MSSTALDLETEIRDLTRMALLADQQVFRAIGNLQCKDGKYVELPDMETVALAMLVVQKLHEAAKELEAKFDHLF
jgi:hypothetical protein